MKQLPDYKYETMLNKIFTEIEDTDIAWQDVLEKFDAAETQLLAQDKDHYWVDIGGKWYIRSKPNYKPKNLTFPSHFDIG